MSVAGFLETCRTSSSDLLIFAVVVCGLVQLSFSFVGIFSALLMVGATFLPVS
jgi:hypothetical protein